MYMSSHGGGVAGGPALTFLKLVSLKTMISSSHTGLTVPVSTAVLRFSSPTSTDT